LSSRHHHTILYPNLIVVAQMAKMIAFDDNEEPICKTFHKTLMECVIICSPMNKSRWTNHTVCSLFVKFWNHSTYYYPIMNAEHLSFVFTIIKNVMTPPTCIIIPLDAKVVMEVVDPPSTPSHCSRSSG
jgi:hypothetical protein